MKQVERFHRESTAHWESRIKRQEEDEEAAARIRCQLDMHDDVTEGGDVYKLNEEAFFKGKTQGYGEGLRQGQINSHDTIEFYKKELTRSMRREGTPSVYHATSLLFLGAAVCFGTLVASGLI